MQDDDDGDDDDDDATLLRLSLLSIIVPLRILPHLRLHSSLRIPVSHGLCVTTCARLAAPPISIAPPHFCNTTISLSSRSFFTTRPSCNHPLFFGFGNLGWRVYLLHTGVTGRGGAGRGLQSSHPTSSELPVLSSVSRGFRAPGFEFRG